MAILEGDLRLLQSVNMADVPEGGGGPSGRVIPDGESNAIFPDVSDVDRTTGRVRFRKLFAHVNTLTTEMVMGTLLTCTQPEDPQISMVLFSNASVFDTREDAAGRVAAYRFFGPVWHGILFETHPKGMKQIRLLQYPGTELPPVGRCFYLVQNEGKPNQFAQYVQISKVTSLDREFVFSSVQPRKYLLNVVTCDITTRLEYDFKGSEANEALSRAPGAAIVRDTFVSDSGNFKSSTKLSKPVQAGDMTLGVESIYVQLIPSSRTESALVNMRPSGQSAALVQAGGGTVRLVTTQSFDSSNVINVGCAITPGTLSVETAAGTLTDKGGQLMNGGTVVGAVRYDAGELAYLSGSISGQKTISFKPSVAILQINESAAVAVTAESRSLNWSHTTPTEIAQGNASVSYMAAGRWYTLVDDGTGVLRGSDSSFGIGQVIYATRTITLNCTVMPDVGSAVLFYWGAVQAYEDTTPAAQKSVKAAWLVIPLNEIPQADGMKIEWEDGGGTCTATVDAGGAIAGTLHGGGSVTGRLDVNAKEIVLMLSRLPPPGTAFKLKFEPKGVYKSIGGAFSGDSDGVCTANLGKDITPLSLELFADLTIDGVPHMGAGTGFVYYVNVQKCRIRVTDNGSGRLILRTGHEAGKDIGSVNYSTGDIELRTNIYASFKADKMRKVNVSPAAYKGPPVYEMQYAGVEYLAKAGRTVPADASGIVARFVQDTLPESAKDLTVRASGLRFRLPIPDGSQAQAGSLRATFGGKVIRDVGGLVLLETIDGTRTYTEA